MGEKTSSPSIKGHFNSDALIHEICSLAYDSLMFVREKNRKIINFH